MFIKLVPIFNSIVLIILLNSSLLFAGENNFEIQSADISIRVYDRPTGEVVKQASAYHLSESKDTLDVLHSDSLGIIRLRCPKNIKGRVRFLITADGYEPLTFLSPLPRDGKLSDYNIRLEHSRKRFLDNLIPNQAHVFLEYVITDLAFNRSTEISTNVTLREGESFGWLMQDDDGDQFYPLTVLIARDKNFCTIAFESELAVMKNDNIMPERTEPIKVFKLGYCFATREFRGGKKICVRVVD